MSRTKRDNLRKTDPDQFWGQFHRHWGHNKESAGLAKETQRKSRQAARMKLIEARYDEDVDDVPSLQHRHEGLYNSW